MTNKSDLQFCEGAGDGESDLFEAGLLQTTSRVAMLL